MRASIGLLKNEHGVYVVRKKVPAHLREAVAPVLNLDKSAQSFLQRSLRWRAAMSTVPAMLKDAEVGAARGNFDLGSHRKEEATALLVRLARKMCRGVVPPHRCVPLCSIPYATRSFGGRDLRICVLTLWLWMNESSSAPIVRRRCCYSAYSKAANGVALTLITNASRAASVLVKLLMMASPVRGCFNSNAFVPGA
jgi:hypothetical protein